MTAPGWYHADGDPEGTQRYWDGSAWVGEPQAADSPPATAAAPPPAAPQGPATADPTTGPFGGLPVSGEGAPQGQRNWAFAVIGTAVLALIGAVGPWVTIDFGPFSESVGGLDGDGTIVLVLAIAAAAIAGLSIAKGRASWMTIVSGICGVLIVLIVMINWGDVTDVGAGWGFYVALVSGILMAVVAFVGDRFIPA